LGDLNRDPYANSSQMGAETMPELRIMTINHLVSNKIIQVFLVFLMIAAGSCILVPGAVAADAGSAVPEIAITSYQIDPAIFMQGDTGTLKVQITNTGDQPVAINRVELLSDHLKVVNYQTYDKVGNLGPGNSLEFSFMIDAGQTDGTFFPIFYVDFTNDGSMRYPIPVKVENTGIVASIISAPTSFSPGNKEEITLSIGNIRENEVNSVNIIPHGDGIRTTQSAIFIGTLGPDEKKDVTFEVTADQPTEMSFDISWRNGPNEHNTTLNLPVTVGDRNVAANLVVNNIEVTQGGAYTTVKGDVTNAGLEDAKSVTVSPAAPARGVDPNPVYVIGALKPDDFSSFEVTLTIQGATNSVPLNIEYRDDDGNMFHKTVDVSLRIIGNSSASSAGSQQSFSGNNPSGRGGPGGFGSFGSGISRIPFLEISVIIILCIIGAIAWRKGYVTRIHDRFRKKK
jgi:hypothetical protein